MSVLAEILIDLAGVGGAGAIAYGAWAMYEPLGFIVGGAMLVGFALRLARQ